MAPSRPAGPNDLILFELTSQVWANVYLDVLDRRVVRDLRYGAYVRYMDDVAAFAHRKEDLWALAAEARATCADRLLLDVKDEATAVAPVAEGVPWLGFRLFPGLVRLDAAGRARFARKVRASMRRAAASEVAEEAEVPRAASLCGHLVQADSRALRRTVLDARGGARRAG